GSRLHRNSLDINAQHGSDSFRHSRPVRANAGSLANQRDIRIRYASAFSANDGNRVLHEEPGGRTFPLRVRRGKVSAYVARAAGREQRICQRVKGDIGIRMSRKFSVMSNVHSTEGNMVSGF